MSSVELIGHLGSFLSSVTFIPQVFKTWKSKSAKDLSMLMLLIIFTSTIVWLIYGVSLTLWPVIVCNSVICLLSLLLIFFKLSFKK
ncbi:MAG TPA: SemiSWEET family transporter [Phnomibacter sp.]|nr:SemiSWEET family transporter [Phnomibacter sp.]